MGVQAIIKQAYTAIGQADYVLQHQERLAHRIIREALFVLASTPGTQRADVQVLHRGMVIPMNREIDGEDFQPEFLARRGLGQFWSPYRDKAQEFGNMILPYANHPVMMTIEHPGPDFEDAETASRNRPIPGWDEGQVVLKRGTPVRVVSIQSNGREYLDAPRVMEI